MRTEPTDPRAGSTWMGWLAAGLGLGGGASLFSALGSAYGPHAISPGQGVRTLEYASTWLGAGWAWALFAFLVGWFAPKATVAPLRAVASLVLAVIAYYLVKAALGMSTDVEVRAVQMWSALALVAGPVMALLGYAARRPSWWALLAGLSAPIVMILDTHLRPAGSERIQPGARLAVYALAAALVAVQLVRLTRTGATHQGEA